MPMATVTRGKFVVDGLEIPADVFTLEGFRRWYGAREEGPGIRASFLGGDVYVEMSPQSYRSHGPVVTQVNARLTLLARELQLGRYFTPPSWLTNRDAGLSTEPDGFLVTYPSFEAGRMRLRPGRDHELGGTPDMVLEVVSPSSVHKDQRDLRASYARAGVPEYWLVDARDERCDVQVLLLDSAAGCYRPQAPDADGWLDSPVWGKAFRRTRFVDRAGLPDFSLEVR